MSLLIPIQGAQVNESKFVVPLSVDVMRELEVEPVLLSGDVQSGEGAIVFINAISEILDAAR